MSNITNTASVNTTEARIAAIDVPANSTFVADQVTAVVQPSATSVKTAKANLAYEYVEQKADDGSLHVSYKPVALSPAKYERHQTLESVVVEADVIVPLSRIEYVEQYRKADAYSGDRDHRFRSIVTGCAACKSCAAQIVWWELRTASNHARSGCFGFPSFGVNGSGGGATGRSP